METVFDTKGVEPQHRARAWIEALCGTYVTVETTIERPEDYIGAIEVSQFGGVNLTETYCSAQQIRRRKQHLSQLDKDCYYLQYLERGQIGLTQFGTEILTDRTTMGLYSASEAYTLDIGDSQGRYIEIPTELLSAECGAGNVPLIRAIDGKTGMGRVLLEFVRTLYAETLQFDTPTRDRLGGELISLLALATKQPDTGLQGAGSEKASMRNARLSAIKRYLEANVNNPLLNTKQIARDNGISARYLHRLFEAEDTSVSDWLWSRRLERAQEALLSAGPNTSISSIAFDHGFNSSSHFSNAFRTRFGMAPSAIKGARLRGEL